MLRTLIFASALALVAPLIAAADDFPRAATGAEVHADNGAVIGHVRAVTRDSAGNITSMDIPGLAPPDAGAEALRVASLDPSYLPARVIDMRPRQRDRVNETGARAPARR
jgi:hypothetical protein